MINAMQNTKLSQGQFVQDVTGELLSGGAPESGAPRTAGPFPPAASPIADRSLSHDQDGSAFKLIGAVSHEMRNPLNGIIGMSYLLGETQLDSTQRNYLDGISSSGEVLLTLVNDLLDLTALQNGAIEPNTGPTDVTHLVNQSIELAAPRAHAKGLAVGAMIDPLLCAWQKDRPLLELDSARVRQVLTNLLSNAIKFTDIGGVQLSIGLRAPVEASGLAPYAPTGAPVTKTELVFDVRDTGHGIAPQDHALVFQPFGRTKTAQVSATEGTGLGLPLSRGLAQALGGSLELVSSIPNQGTHMRLVLPLPEGLVERNSNQDNLPLAGQRVLMVLDASLANSPEADALASTLHQLGAQTRLLSAPDELNGAPENIDHVLVDAGFDHAMLWSRLCLPQVGLRPVILLRPDNRRLLDDLREAGFSGYLIRPLRQSSLVAMLTHRFDDDVDTLFLADPADTERAEQPNPGKRILIAEDNPVNARLAEAALEREGHDVTVVGDGARAIALAGDTQTAQTPFDLILLDLAMPVLDGFAAARQLRDAGFGGRLIAYSGNTDPALIDQVKAAGFDGFAHKPLAPDALQALVTDPPAA
jgi:signal transduction histidine kinase/CheY-like chemotaxis protein